ncbi:MAG: pilus assembly protein TadG-related protein [Gemmatimonadales bacterium]
MKRKNRRGAVLVLAAFIMIVALSVLVIVVDISRVYVQKNELQTAADAAALAGAMEIMVGSNEATIKDSAISFAGKNKALGNAVTVVAADVKCGIYNAATYVYPGDSPNCGAYENAVTVTARATQVSSFVGFLSSSNQVTALGRAYGAYIGATKCIKPWAIPYTKLTKTLQPTNPDTLRSIDSVDAAALRTLTQAQRTFMLKIGSPPDGGNFGSLEIPSTDPNAPTGGANLYKYNITDCNSTLIGPGDTIDTEPGGMKGPTVSGVEEFCTNNGSFNKGTGNCYDEDGNLGITVKAALWSYGTTKSNGRFAVIVRQIVSFVLENISNGQAEIKGHFLPYLTAGDITTVVTTIQRPILVR